MLHQLKTFPSIQLLKTWLQNENELLFEGLWDAPKAILSLLLLKEANQNVLIITGDEENRPLCDAISLFSKGGSLSFPALDLDFGKDSPVSLDRLGRRFEVLKELTSAREPLIVVAPIQAVLQRVCPPKTLLEKTLTLRKGEEFPFDLLSDYLVTLGYRRQSVVGDKGEFAVRGGIVDLFPISSPTPFRIDFFDNQIDQIRTFDPSSQRSMGRAEEIFIPPAGQEMLSTQEGKGATLLDYLGEKTAIIFDDLLAIEDQYVALKDLFKAPPSPLISFSDFFHLCGSKKKLYWTKNPLDSLNETIYRQRGRDALFSKTDALETVQFEMFDQTIETKRASHPFESIERVFWEGVEKERWMEVFLEKGRDFKVVFVSTSPLEENAFKERMESLCLPLPKEKGFVQGSLSCGFVLLDGLFVLFPYSELTKKQPPFREKGQIGYAPSVPNFQSLEKGDLVVHFHNGIGKFSGIEVQNNHRGEKEEFLRIEYANQGKLYVPLSQSHLVNRYIGTQGEGPPLSTLGSKKWQQVKANAEKAIIGYAKDLLHLQAMREAKGGHSFPKKSEGFSLFEQEFPFTETKDQLQAIRSIEEDMESEKAMDRLVCGDVGYGKTEVAMRAAFKAAYDGKKQVAVLVPTTLLAMQHYENFKERMAGFPIQVGLVSRFIKPKETKQTLEEVAKGTIDILIGTHRIIGRDVTFKDLGLIIIDEEQRFGVRVKESLKKMKVGVDCLTLSATPIPRTLYFSLIGARDLSVMETPPQQRVPIKTILAEREGELIRSALLRELSRKGQAYFVHNRIETIDEVARELRAFLPTARIQVGHAQMPPETLDRIFHQFKRGEIDVLVSTTIVENGVDIPNANTILIDRADTFGVADLYQLRGRVGRSNRPSYAYFLIPKNRSLPEISRKRLNALVETSGFGGGMQLALRDLELRGAGDILGVQQSGNICAIGFHLYCKLLKKTVESLKKKGPLFLTETRMEFHHDAGLPLSYIAETDLRMHVYQRLGETTTREAIDALFDELIDRFGPLPLQAKWLYHLNRIRVFGIGHQFILLKVEKMILHAQRQVGKRIVEKKILLPLESNPETFEWVVIGLIKRDFEID